MDTTMKLKRITTDWGNKNRRGVASPPAPTMPTLQRWESSMDSDKTVLKGFAMLQIFLQAVFKDVRLQMSSLRSFGKQRRTQGDS
jgi:hypothetical protein